jgi:hypothetical protein
VSRFFRKNQTVHAYRFDVLGRPTADAVTIPEIKGVGSRFQETN